jgi:hypothetical protein
MKAPFVGKTGANVLPVQALKLCAYIADMMANIVTLETDVTTCARIFEIINICTNYVGLRTSMFAFIVSDSSTLRIFFCMLIPENSKLLKSALLKITQHN